jgi:hypothetical protein
MKQSKIRTVFISIVLAVLLVNVTAANAAGYILPWRSGTTAWYGPLGVHECGFQLADWKAVDLFPAENQVYAVESGNVNYLCRDGTQVSMRVGSIMYVHLQDNGQQVGDHYEQGQAMGGMVSGTFQAACGHAEQQPDHYHLHMCFLPQNNRFYADGYELDTISGGWTKDGQTVNPSGTLTAAWNDAVDPPVIGGGGSGMFNIWDWLLRGLMSIFAWFMNTFFLPPGSAGAGTMRLIQWSQAFLSGVTSVIELTAAALSTFNWWIPLACFAIDMVLFAIQLAVSIYLFVTSLIKSLPFL